MTIIVVAVVGLAVAGCGGGGADMSVPIQAANDAYGSLTAGNFDAFVGYLHASSVSDFEQRVQPVLNAMAPTDSLGNPVDSMNIFGTWRNSEAFMQQPPESIFVQVLSSIFEVAPEIQTTFASIENEFVGGVLQADTAFLVSRTSMTSQGQPFTEMNVVSMVETPTGWKMEMPTQLRGIIDLALRSLLQQRG